jgi:hypothetical protein
VARAAGTESLKAGSDPRHPPGEVGVSHSRRKNPIVAVTTAESDKQFKKAEHSRERVAVKVALARGDDPPAGKLFGNPWKGDKDGKLFRPDLPGVLRK